MNSAIVTGATSFIGIHLIRELLQRKYRVYAVARSDSRNLSRLQPHPRMTVIHLNLNEIRRLPVLIDVNISSFFHLAWEGARMPHRDNAGLQESNCNGAMAALEATVMLGCRTFVGMGSQAEYGNHGGLITEKSLAAPITEYGKYKFKACHDGMAYAGKAGIRFIWSRIFSIYGPYDYPETLIMSCLDKMLKDEEIKLTACTQNWDYLYIKDAVCALIDLSESKYDGVYNIASGQARPLKEFVLRMKDIMNSASELKFGAVEYGTDGPVSFEPSVDKLINNIGWKAKTSFDDGIKATACFVRDQHSLRG